MPSRSVLLPIRSCLFQVIFREISLKHGTKKLETQFRENFKKILKNLKTLFF